MMRHSCSLMKRFFYNYNENGGIPLSELHQMDIGAISPNGDLYEKVYTWHNQMIFVVKKKEH